MLDYCGANSLPIGTKIMMKLQTLLPWGESVWHDACFASRSLLRSPGFTIVVVFSLALAIGANAAIFSVIDALMLKPLPVYDPDRLMEVARTDDANAYTYSLWRQISAQQDVFSSAFAYSLTSFVASEHGQRQFIPGLYVSGQYFETLGVPAILGRTLAEWNDIPDNSLNCVISYGLWERRYGKDRNIIGQDLRLEGHNFQIVGVTPAYFWGIDVGETFDVIVPLSSERMLHPDRPAADAPNKWWLSVVGRLRPGMSTAQASARLQVLALPIFNASLPAGANLKDWQNLLRLRLKARPMPTGISDMRDRYRQAIVVSMILVGVVLLVACLNIATLCLARYVARQRELATRIALGATRLRILRQLLTESFGLAILGVALGLVLAKFAINLLIAGVSSSQDPHFLAISIDTPTVVFLTGISLFGILSFGIIPAFRASRQDVHLAIKGQPPGAKTLWLSLGRALVTVQVVFSIMLLIAAGLFTKTLQSLLAEDLGYRPQGVLVMQADAQDRGQMESAHTADTILDAIRTLPQVKSAARSMPAQAMGTRSQINVIVDNPTEPARNEFHSFFISVSPKFFRTMDTPLIAGRDFSEADGWTSPAVAIISRKAADSFFPGMNPVGLRYYQVDQSGGRREYPVEIVGIVKDAKYGRPNQDPLPIIYRPVAQSPKASELGRFYIRFSGDVSGVIASIREVIKAAAPYTNLDFHLLSRDVDELLQRERFTATASITFSLVTFVMVAIGIYGIASYSTAQRTNEIGLRMAIGASRQAVIRMIVIEGVKMVLVGIAFGVPAGCWMMLLIPEMLYGIRSTDPLTILLCCFLMLAVAVFATFIAANRASKLDPLVALKSE